MSRREKLIQRLLKRPPEAAFGDVRKVLEMFGWTHDRTTGSHATFTKGDEYPIVLPVHNNRVRRRYIVDVCERLGLDDDGQE